MSIFDRIAAGYYRTKLAYPAHPVRPVILAKPVGQLTDQQLERAMKARQCYERELAAYQTATAKIAADNTRLEAEFWNDLCEDFGVDRHHPFISKMCYMAYERGHSAGYGDIASCFNDLMPLWEEAKKMEYAARVIERPVSVGDGDGDPSGK